MKRSKKINISTKVLTSVIIGISAFSSTACVNAQVLNSQMQSNNRNDETMLSVASNYNNVEKTNGDKTTYILNANEQELTKPFESGLYYARSVMSENCKRGFDYVLKNILNYNNDNNKYQVVNERDEKVVKYNIDFAKAGIKVTKDELNYIQKALIANEPRAFLIKDGSVNNTPQDLHFDESGTYVNSGSVNIGNGFEEGHKYLDALKEIETETTKLLGLIKPGMTNLQIAETLRKGFEQSISYVITDNSGNMLGSLGNTHKGVCDGFTKGFMYLLMRAGISSVWVKGDVPTSYADNAEYGSHAGNDVNIDGKGYVMDTTGHGSYTGSGDTIANTDKDYTRRRPENDGFVKVPTLEKVDPDYKEAVAPTQAPQSGLTYQREHSNKELQSNKDL